MTCPRCGETETTEALDNGMWFCPGCDHAWKPTPPPRLFLPAERRRRDLE